MGPRRMRMTARRMTLQTSRILTSPVRAPRAGPTRTRRRKKTRTRKRKTRGFKSLPRPVEPIGPNVDPSPRVRRRDARREPGCSTSWSERARNFPASRRWHSHPDSPSSTTAACRTASWNSRGVPSTTRTRRTRRTTRRRRSRSGARTAAACACRCSRCATSPRARNSRWDTCHARRIWRRGARTSRPGTGSFAPAPGAGSSPARGPARTRLWWI
mmetsp:Transcript_2651/g.12005  ORF Transcript_2651/g.12005 Transcript_2651/m.12005 type:complete len:215 (-) Transcript_2651:822-1466(-)